MLRFARAAAVAATAAGALLFAAGPASAQYYWQPWVNPGDYSCGDTIHHAGSKYVFFQTCIIHGSGKALQPVLIISNTSDKKITIYGRVFANWESDGGKSYCHDSDLSANARTACYGATSTGRVGINTAHSIFYMNTIGGTFSPTASYLLN